MRKISIFFICAFLIPLAGARVVMAGAWGQKKGNLFLSLQSYYYASSKYYDENGHLRRRGGTFKKWEFNPYLEWGMTNRDTLTLNIFYDWLSDDASGHSKETNGFADIEAGWQRKIFRSTHHVLSLQGLLIIPTGYDVKDDPRLGYDCWGAEVGILHGWSFKMFNRDGFIDSGIGYRRYFGYPSSQIRPKITLGWNPFKKVQILMEGKLEYGLKDGSMRQLGPNLIAQPNYRLLKATFGLNFQLDRRCSLVIAVYRHVWGEMTGAGGGAYASLWLRF